MVLAAGMIGGSAAIADDLRVNRALLTARTGSPLVRLEEVRSRVSAVSAADLARETAFAGRQVAQQERLALPCLPTTTIGSFPQTTALRQARASFRAGQLSQSGYEAAMRAEISAVITTQTDLGLDVLVHGEPERNDMVQYFAEQLTGFVCTQQGWVQSYGTRYVRPPIIVGDVARPGPMTVQWATYAQSLTDRPLKGMLTGPVTMLAWSFVRDDQPLRHTATQVALALRDEVTDLEHAGIAVIQVDEPALRETLPLRQQDRSEYLEWATRAFRLTTAGVRDETQIHTHMCYAEFGDILPAIIDMDADVISLEAARSDMTITAHLACCRLPERGWTRSVGYPLAASAVHRRDRVPAPQGGVRLPRRQAVGQPRLRAEDPRLHRDPFKLNQSRHRGKKCPRRRGVTLRRVSSLAGIVPDLDQPCPDGEMDGVVAPIGVGPGCFYH